MARVTFQDYKKQPVKPKIDWCPDEIDEEKQAVYFSDIACIRSTVPDKGDAGAILVKSFGYPPIWIPYAWIHDDSEVYEESHFGLLVVKLRWAKIQGWI